MNISYLKTFIEAAQSENFTTVAAVNHLTSRAVSQQISKIEEILDTKLFDRTANKITLNTYGEYFLKRATQIVDDYEQALIDLKKFKVNLNNTLSIGYFSPYDAVLVQEAAYQVMLNHPGIQLNIKEQSIERLYRDMNEGALDLSLSLEFGKTGTYDDYNLNNIESIDIFEDQLSLAVSSFNPLASKATINHADVHKYDVLYYIPDDSSYVEKKFKGVDSIFKDFETIYNMKSFEDLIMKVSLNQGISFVPKKFIPPLIASNSRLVIKPLDKNQNFNYKIKVHLNKNSNNAMKNSFLKEVQRAIDKMD